MIESVKSYYILIDPDPSIMSQFFIRGAKIELLILNIQAVILLNIERNEYKHVIIRAKDS